MDGAASLTPGTGRIDLLGYATPERVGARLDYEQRLRRFGLSTFAQAWAGAARNLDGEGSGWKKDAGAMAGLRMRF